MPDTNARNMKNMEEQQTTFLNKSMMALGFAGLGFAGYRKARTTVSPL